MRNKFILGVLVLSVFLLHQDFWNWRKSEPFVFGFLPGGLAYHAGYCVLAVVMMAVLVKFAWSKELDQMESQPENSTADEHE